ncbi:MAG: phage tail terminator-like protein [Caulobacter sp.]
MADLAAVADALLTRCSSLAVGSPALTIAWPDVAFTPPASGKYLEVRVFFNRPRFEGLASGVLDQGLLQVTVVWPKGAGIIQPASAAEAVKAHFPKGLTLSGGVKVVAAPYAASPLIDQSETRIPVTITWTA